MNPTTVHGAMYWDEAVLPIDEFDARLAGMRGAMAAAGLDALFVWGGGFDANADLAYLAGSPTNGAFLVTRDGEASLYTPGTGRELYFRRTLTWVKDVGSMGGISGKVLAANLERRGLTSGRLGVVGLEALSPVAYDNIVSGLAGFELVPFDDQYRALRTPKRPREVLVMRKALKIATDAMAAGEAAFAAGASNASALVEAERVARTSGARDFRGLVNTAPDALRPFEGADAARHEPLMMWVGIDLHGYWADMTNASAGPAGSNAAKALEAMIATIRTGARAGAVADAGCKALPPETVESALSYGLGSGVGLKLTEGPLIVLGSHDAFSEGALISLRVIAIAGGQPSIASALVQVEADGANRLTPA